VRSTELEMTSVLSVCVSFLRFEASMRGNRNWRKEMREKKILHRENKNHKDQELETW
jgi:hypothetical protein